MNRISRELLSIAREIKALDEEGDGSGFQPYHDYENAEQERLDMAQKQGKKYILHHKDHGLWRIQACKNFSDGSIDIRKGEFGGLIESEKNLSHKGDCWVFDDAKIFGNAKVYDNVYVRDNAKVYGNAQVYEAAIIADNAMVYDNAKVYRVAIIAGNAQVYDSAKVHDYAKVFDDAKIFGNAKVYNSAWVHGSAQVYDNARVFGKAEIHGNAKVDYDVRDQEITK